MNNQTNIPEARILVVDDTRANVRLLAGLLDEHSYNVQFAFDGPRALSLAGAKHPDLILLDIQMPVSLRNLQRTLEEKNSQLQQEISERKRAEAEL